MLKITITEDTDKTEKRAKCLKYLQKHRVDVGLTSSGPVVRPALAQEDLRTEMAERLAASCEAACKGDLSGTRAGLENAGQRGADGIREYIDAGIPPPNSPVTLSGGWIYNRVAKKGVPVSGKNGNTTIKDTAALYNDFSYELTER